MAKTHGVELAFASCRSMGHEWHHAKAIGSDDYGTLRERGFSVPFGGTYGMVGFPSTCTMCGTERVRWITRSGESHVRYHHPQGYDRHGDDRLTPTEWRRAYVSSVFEGFRDPYIKTKHVQAAS